jgi:alpha-glucosidase
VWQDGDTPNAVHRVVREVASRDVLSLRLAGAGGAVAILERLP